MQRRSIALTVAMAVLIVCAASPARADILCKDNSSGVLRVRTVPNSNGGETKLPVQFLSSNTLVQITGANLQVVSGAGSTGASVNGLGNVIVGYNENTSAHSRAGSHNVVVGAEHGYASFAGLVSGASNQVTDEAAAAIGGQNNIASGEYGVVSGGQGNTASGQWAAVSGGTGNVASGQWTSISGGLDNSAIGNYSWIGTGTQNVTNTAYSSITGGLFNTTDDNGTYASVTGGNSNTASGYLSVISGGAGNQTIQVPNAPLSTNAVVSGGAGNTASYSDSTVSGGCSLSTTSSCQETP
jgi:hypothetical protein